jgi:hypothetical protein
MGKLGERAWVRIASGVRAWRYVLLTSKGFTSKTRSLESMRTQARSLHCATSSNKQWPPTVRPAGSHMKQGETSMLL